MSFKKLLLTSLSVCLLAVGSPAFASSSVEESPATSIAQTIDLENDLDQLSKDVIVSDVLTYDELVSLMSEEQGITEEEASAIILNNSGANNRISLESRESAARLNTYRTVTKYLEGINNSYYRPSMEFYCQTSEGDGFRGIIKIMTSSMNTLYNNGSTTVAKTYVGTLYVNLQDANTIYYIADGKFYNNGGIQSVTGNIQIGVGGSTTLGISATAATNLYMTIFQSDPFTWY
ncbi:hypothetical protein M2444_004702 [Paenibacillus sp. PastF-3]|uniref:hypothetical protein n=1 Tax=unclassified Paenibacillus TaxID=185978 RepID=UPI000BA0473B|nr:MULTISPECIES: hypothetical protein [unclassified Paenibacillus]MBY3621156.1 hypothetical protein [Acinetobacter sp. CUI P1]MDH6372873.1 hypothetical protein [Paenibacillus sp. PastF-3]OZQ74607.1 hypothetical protein CA598_31490 [Paenibacillus sp. VTT E-133291]